MMIEELVPLYAIMLFILTLTITNIKKTAQVHNCQKIMVRALIYKFPDLAQFLKEL